MERKEIDRTFGGNVIPIRTRYEAVRWGVEWERYAERMDALYALACIRADMAEALVESYAAEVERLRGILK